MPTTEGSDDQEARWVRILAGDYGKVEEHKMIAARIDRYSEPEWVVAAALLRAGHDSGDRIFIGDLGIQFDRVLRE